MRASEPALIRNSKREAQNSLSRREFLSVSTLFAVGLTVAGCKTSQPPTGPGPIIDIHQHVNYSGRPDDVLIAHQQNMGVTRTILLPAGRPVKSPATHDGFSNGLQAECSGNEACYRLAKANRRKFFFGANEVPDIDGAVQEIEKYLKLGAVIVAEQKFGIDCDASQMQRIYQVAADYHVPVLMHWQHGMYNFGFERFHKMLQKFPHTTFIGHAQTWWANIDKNYVTPTELYPKGKWTPGGLTDRYLSDHPNLFGDLSAGSGLNALTRDEEQTVGFLQRHQDKLLYGSDCNDWAGTGLSCQGAQTIAAVRRLAPNKEIERKLLYENAKKLFRP